MADKGFHDLKGIWRWVVGTVIVCSGIFSFFYKHMVDLKNEQISLLERQVKQLSEVGPVPQAVKNLQEDIKSLEKKFYLFLL